MNAFPAIPHSAAAETKRDFFACEMLAMAEISKNHTKIVRNFCSKFRTALKGRESEPFAEIYERVEFEIAFGGIK